MHQIVKEPQKRLVHLEIVRMLNGGIGVKKITKRPTKEAVVVRKSFNTTISFYFYLY